MNGAELLLKTLEDCGVDTIFGYPGGRVIKIYDELFKQNKIKHILPRHEQGAVHMAQGYARTSGKVGCVLVTSGPGSTNTITGINDAYIDSTPLVCITGQVSRNLIGTDAFQEADTAGITRSIAKHNYLVTDVNDLEHIIKEAFHLASTGRPGPVLIDIPSDLQVEEVNYQNIEYSSRKSYKTNKELDAISKAQIKEAIDLLKSSKKPVIYAGGGVINSGPKACQVLQDFSNTLNIPTTLTLMGLGAYPARGKNFLGMLGMHGTYEANMAMHEADLILAIGSRFSDRITGKLDKFAPNAKIIHIDIDPVSINRVVPAYLGIVGDVYETLQHIMEEININDFDTNRKDWWSKIEEFKAKDSLYYDKKSEIIKPEYVIEKISDITYEKNIDTVVSTDVGQHQMWTAQYFKIDKPNHWLSSGGFGTMGFGLPACIGGAFAKPNSANICFTSEGSFQMNIQEIATAVNYGLPIKIVLLNNSRLGMVRQWQELMFEERYSETEFDTSTLPDFQALAKAYHADGALICTKEELEEGIEKMLSSDKPFILEVMVDPAENVLPMIPPGKGHNEMIIREK
ncbi:MAG: biosynthetic-type acetolactate synthase large subunit [Alphaproteobacteria bacterium]|nr:biosynthetic-type acetolactate synthase large subunit [Alphaproteobacteria bacterium]